jgi:DNA-binding IscR family transcriptional regulator
VPIAACEIRHVFAKVAESARDVLDRTTIADALVEELAAPEATKQGAKRSSAKARA